MIEQENHLIKLFCGNAERAGFRLTIAKDNREVSKAVTDFIAGAESVYCPRRTETENRLEFDEKIVTDDFRSAVVCVDESDGAIAETGSVIYLSGRDRSLSVGLLPEHHIVLLPKSKIYLNFEEFLSAMSAPPANITLETGPSKTADIELTLTEGVHGPEKVSIVLIG
jgi:L-lactate utilization protein LutC